MSLDPWQNVVAGNRPASTRHTSGSRKRERIRGLMRPGLFSARRARFVKPPAKTKRISRRGAEHAEKDKGTRFDLRLLPFVALQTFEILSACEDFIERSGFSPSPVLAFSACSAPLREILLSPLRALPPGAMPTTRLSSPKSALRGHASDPWQNVVAGNRPASTLRRIFLDEWPPQNVST